MVSDLSFCFIFVLVIADGWREETSKKILAWCMDRDDIFNVRFVVSFKHDSEQYVINDLSSPVLWLIYISKCHQGMNKLFTIGSLSCHVFLFHCVGVFAIFSSDMISTV